MANNVLLIVKTALRRYAIRHDDLLDIKLVASAADLQAAGMFDRPCVGIELGPLLDPDDQSRMVRRRALIVPLRRRYIALLVDYVEDFLDRAGSVPLPELMRTQLREPWATGALMLDDDLIVLLDLRAVARSALLNHAGERP